VGHDLAQRVSMVWIDPDDPGELFDRHWLTSSRRPAPLRFRAGDYGTADAPLGAEAVRAELAPVIGGPVDGPVRMLTQPRRWGWLFNPLSVYFAWSQQGADEGSGPVGVVLEVTNTPWKERHRYAVALDDTGDALVGSFAKTFHVSPFLGLDHDYELRIRSNDRRIRVELDVVGDDGATVLTTRLTVDCVAPTRPRLRRFVFDDALANHRVSAGIHAHAARLWAKGVRFVPHPGAKAAPPAHPGGCPMTSAPRAAPRPVAARRLP
jgi:DUF1365 family protein